MDLEKLFSVTTATHCATQRSYMVVGRARISTSRPLNEGDTVVVYRRSEGELHAREEAEFNDGRFTVETHKLPEGMGFDPLKLEGNRSKEAAWERLRYAYVLQQQFVPDQTALVWRVDLGMFRHELIRLRALADINRVEIEKLKAEIERLKNG